VYSLREVNTGGVPLTVFELLTATYAIDDFDLRGDWEKHKKVLDDSEIVKSIENTEFLQIISLVSTYQRRIQEIRDGKKPEDAKGINCTRKEILKLQLEEYKRLANKVTENLKRVERLLFLRDYSRLMMYLTHLRLSPSQQY